MNKNDEEDEVHDWDEMMESVMDLIPAKLSHQEWKVLFDNIHTTLWAYVSDFFDNASFEFQKGENRKGEVRLWISIGEDRAAFQKGFDISTLLAEAHSIEGLTLVRDAIIAKIEQLRRETND